MFFEWSNFLFVDLAKTFSQIAFPVSNFSTLTVLLFLHFSCTLSVRLFIPVYPLFPHIMLEAPRHEQLNMQRRHFLIRAQILVTLLSFMPLLLKVVEDMDSDSDDGSSSSLCSNHSAEVACMQAGLRGFQQLQRKLFPKAHQQTFVKPLEYADEVPSRVSVPSELSESSGDAPREETPSPNEGPAAPPIGTSSRKRPLDNSDHQIIDSTLPNAKRSKYIPEAVNPRDKAKNSRLLTQANLEFHQKSLPTTNSHNAVLERISAWSPSRRNRRRCLQR